jgi:hypothetical protein
MIDRPVLWSKRIGIGFHLLICKWCRRYGKQIRLLRKLAHERRDDLEAAAPQKLSVEARERLKSQLNRNRS